MQIKAMNTATLRKKNTYAVFTKIELTDEMLSSHRATSFYRIPILESPLVAEI